MNEAIKEAIDERRPMSWVERIGGEYLRYTMHVMTRYA